jgi:hypothetical protein
LTEEDRLPLGVRDRQNGTPHRAENNNQQASALERLMRLGFSLLGVGLSAQSKSGVPSQLDAMEMV